jgi:CBS domain containing-hemolysin-like protein
MSEAPARGEPSDSEHRGLPALVSTADNDPPAGLLSRIMHILFGWKSATTRADLEQVLAAPPAGSGFSAEEAAMVRNILGLRDYRVERVMIPRADIVAVQQDIALAALIKVFESAGHSRLVVYNDTLDDPTGMVHIRDLISFMAARAGGGASADPLSAAPREEPLRTDLDFANLDLTMPLAATHIVRDILYAPPSMPALDLLAKMQATRIHLALVIDEYGGTDGLVSMEDLVEIIVGDIADEHDVDEMPAITRQSDGSFLAAGRASLDEVRAVIGNEFDFGEARGEVDTLGGYLVIRAGHVPVRGELVPGPDSFEAEVLDADPRRVKRVKIYRRKDRRPALPREAPAAAKPPPLRAAPPRDEPNRPNPNSTRPS